ncbi:MAG: TusE/DsrC/DsvC family sulfur relay protein [Candidatus Thiodiazotropha sp.]
MSDTIDLVQVRIDDEGYLIDPDDWDESIAHRLAASEDLQLEADHWKVIQFMRAFYSEHRVAADARFVIRYLSDECGMGRQAKGRLFRLFPYGYVKQACKIAGMRRPRAWSTG